MAISPFDDPRKCSSVISKLLPLNSHLSFSSLLNIVYLLSYSKFGFTTTSKATTNGIPMVVTIVWGFMKCKLQVALYNFPCNPPWLPSLVEIPSHVIVVCNQFLVANDICNSISCSNRQKLTCENQLHAMDEIFFHFTYMAVV